MLVCMYCDKSIGYTAIHKTILRIAWNVQSACSLVCFRHNRPSKIGITWLAENDAECRLQSRGSAIVLRGEPVWRKKLLQTDYRWLKWTTTSTTVAANAVIYDKCESYSQLLDTFMSSIRPLVPFSNICRQPAMYYKCKLLHFQLHALSITGEIIHIFHIASDLIMFDFSAWSALMTFKL